MQEEHAEEGAVQGQQTAESQQGEASGHVGRPKLGSWANIFTIISGVVLVFGLFKATVFFNQSRVERAWAVVYQAEGHAGDGGRSNALEFLCNQGKRLDFINLKDATISDISLAGANLRAVDFTLCRLENVDFSNADLTDAILDEAILVGVDLSASRGLTVEQILEADGDKNTLLPSHVLNWFAMPHIREWFATEDVREWYELREDQKTTLSDIWKREQ